MTRETSALSVLIGTSRYLPSGGGLETHVYEAVLRLVKSGVDVTLLTTAAHTYLLRLLRRSPSFEFEPGHRNVATTLHSRFKATSSAAGANVQAGVVLSGGNAAPEVLSEILLGRWCPPSKSGVLPHAFASKKASSLFAK